MGGQEASRRAPAAATAERKFHPAAADTGQRPYEDCTGDAAGAGRCGQYSTGASKRSPLPRARWFLPNVEFASMQYFENGPFAKNPPPRGMPREFFEQLPFEVKEL